MAGPLDDVRYYAGRIGVAEAQAAQAASIATRHTHERLARLYRERLTALLQESLEDDEDKGCRA